jgi:hypothetical protein
MNLAQAINIGFNRALLWLAGILCLLTGLYFAINHTLLIFAPHNYILSPLGDDALDGVSLLYPILLGKKSIWSIFQPYADHRLVTERVLGLFDFLFNQGTQSSHPYRLAIMLWLGYCLFIAAAILPNKNFEAPVKLLLAGVYMTVLFSGTNITNFNTTLNNTWPLALIFVLSAFIFTARYCDALANDASSSKLFTYIGLTFFSVMLGLYTFGVSLILWPIIFIVLIKNKAFSRHALGWIGCALLSYYLYTHGGWRPLATQYGVINFFHGHAIDMLFYLSRLLSLPLIPSAIVTGSIATMVIAVAVLAIGIQCILFSLQKNTWSKPESILFACLFFGFFTTISIAITRFWMEFEVSVVALRFTMTNFILMTCVIASGFIYLSSHAKELPFLKSGLALLTAVWLIAFFAAGDLALTQGAGMYNNSAWNSFYIVEATGVPIDNGFLAEIKLIQNEQSIPALQFLHDTQKTRKKGVYSLWLPQYINKPLQALPYTTIDCGNSNSKILLSTDFRRHHNPGLFINVAAQSQTLTADWDIFYTNQKNNIIGFALSTIPATQQRADRLVVYKNNMNSVIKTQLAAPYFPAPAIQALWDQLMGQKTLPRLLWCGAINTQLLESNPQVTAWAVNKDKHQLCKIGTITV